MNKWLILALTLCLPCLVQADMIPALHIENNANSSQTISLNLQILLFMTVLTLLPGFIIAMTSFTRIIIVLAILRQAIGLGQTPTNHILIGMALFITFFTMTPVVDKIQEEAINPLLEEKITLVQALENGAKPLKAFMLHHTRENDLALFAELAEVNKDNLDAEPPLRVLVPAYLTSELKTAFQIGFIIFLPFLMVDIIVASVLMSMGMMMLSPLIISLPFKVLLFVLIDGWVLVLGTLSSSIIGG